jgi:hypothetical protein
MSGTQGATAQSGQAAGAGRYGSTSGSGMYMLRVSDGGSGNAKTGMPSSTAGQSDARSAAGQQGGRVYHLMADASTNLAAHVGHQIEVTGTLESGSASGSPSMGAHGGSATTGSGAAGSGSGSTGYAGQGTSGSGSTGSGAAGGTGATTGTTTGSQAGSSAGTASMQHMATQAATTGVLKVTNVKMIAATCR